MAAYSKMWRSEMGKDSRFMPTPEEMLNGIKEWLIDQLIFNLKDTPSE